MTMQMRKQISTLEAGQQELFKKNEGAMEELRRANAALKQEIDALKREKESFLEDIFKTKVLTFKNTQVIDDFRNVLIS